MAPLFLFVDMNIEAEKDYGCCPSFIEIERRGKACQWHTLIGFTEGGKGAKFSFWEIKVGTKTQVSQQYNEDLCIVFSFCIHVLLLLFKRTVFFHIAMHFHFSSQKRNLIIYLIDGQVSHGAVKKVAAKLCVDWGVAKMNTISLW